MIRKRLWVLALAIGVIVFGLTLSATAAPDARSHAQTITLGDCRGNPPEYVIAHQHIPSSYQGVGDPSSVVRFRHTGRDDSKQHDGLSLLSQTGTLLGLAYDSTRHVVYAASYLKSWGVLGPEGPDVIYSIDLASGQTRPWTRLPAGAKQPDSGPQSMAWIGKAGLGDIDVDPEGDALLVMNLFDQRVYRLSLADQSILGTFPIGAAAEPWAADARPFALAIWDGWVFHGVVDSRESAADTRPPVGYVYRSRPDGSELTRVTEFSLGDARRRVAWRAWRDSPYVRNGKLEFGQPMISDLEFTASGDMVIGIRDRNIDMFFDSYTARNPQGGVLRARRDGDRWSVLTTTREWYEDNTQYYNDASQGMLAAVPGADMVLATTLGVAPALPRQIYFLASGVTWFDHATLRPIAHEVTTACLPRCQPPIDQLGDVEALCRAEVPPTPTPTPSPTSTLTLSPTPSPTPSPSPTAAATTATPTKTPTDSPTLTLEVPTTPAPGSWTVFLPVASNSGCAWTPEHTDIALVLDMSSSMDGLTRTGRTKRVAALEAASTFVSLLALGPGQDQVAVVGFNEAAWIEQNLSDNENLIRAALNRLPSRAHDGTRLDLALSVGGAVALGQGHRASNSPVVILLTDGVPNGVPPAEDGRQATTVLRVADRVKASGVRLFVIGLGHGDDIDEQLLRAAASSPKNYYNTPDAENLARIYAELAIQLDCP